MSLLIWCYQMQFFWQLLLHCWKKSIASCQIHVTRSNLELEIVSVVKINAIIAESRTEYSCCKLEKVVRQVNVAK